MEEAYQFLIKELPLQYNDKVVVGVSGGPDSMCLLHLLLRVRNSFNITIICAHVNHNTGRIGQKEDEQFVQQFCLKNGIIFEKKIIEHYGDDNFHTEARTIRYHFFKELVKKYDAKYVFTAHHGDDLVETILMRLVRGSTLKGYSGFSKVVNYPEYTLVRPLISLTKDQIESYMKKNKFEYRVDSSNSKDTYTRNRFRKYLLPRLKEEEPCVHQKFYKFSKLLIQCSAYIDKQAKQEMNNVYFEHVLKISQFKDLDDIIQMRILQLILEEIYQDDLLLITDKHVELLRKIIYSSKANTFVHLPNNIQVNKAYDLVTLSVIREKETVFEIEIDEIVCLPNGKTIEMIEQSSSDSNDICRINTQEITLPLYVRNKKEGDKMTVKGMLGRKKISDIFIDNKIDKLTREIYPVVCDSEDNIVWLPGLKKSKICKEKQEKYDIILRYY